MISFANGKSKNNNNPFWHYRTKTVRYCTCQWFLAAIVLLFNKAETHEKKKLRLLSGKEENLQCFSKFSVSEILIFYSQIYNMMIIANNFFWCVFCSHIQTIFVHATNALSKKKNSQSVSWHIVICTVHIISKYLIKFCALDSLCSSESFGKGKFCIMPVSFKFDALNYLLNI